MLISPLRLHHDLTSLLTSPAAASSSSASTTGSPHGPHTALLILPEGRLLASTSRYDELYADDGGYETGVEAGDEADGADTDAGEGGGEDEPYLDEPERIRLLCGLASQWEEDESPRVECELGRLLLTPIYLPPPEPTTIMAQNLPATKGLQPDLFVLVLNGTRAAPWSGLAAKAEEFKRKWDRRNPVHPKAAA